MGYWAALLLSVFGRITKRGRLKISDGLYCFIPQFLQSCRCFQGEGFIGAFPCEFGLFPAKVSVGRGFAVNRAEQVEHLYDTFGTQVEMFADKFNQFGFVQFAGAEGVDGNGSRLGDTDGVGNLNLALGGQACGDNVFGDIAAGVCGGAVNFGRRRRRYRR